MGMNVLSLFDGMSCGRIALERAEVKVDNYYSSEIDKILNSDKENVKELLKITDFKNRPQNVRYPVAEDNGSYKVYNWFVANRGGVNQYSNNLTLPKISAKDNSLPAYKK